LNPTLRNSNRRAVSRGQRIALPLRATPRREIYFPLRAQLVCRVCSPSGRSKARGLGFASLPEDVSERFHRLERRPGRKDHAWYGIHVILVKNAKLAKRSKTSRKPEQVLFISPAGVFWGTGERRPTPDKDSGQCREHGSQRLEGLLAPSPSLRIVERGALASRWLRRWIENGRKKTRWRRWWAIPFPRLGNRLPDADQCTIQDNRGAGQCEAIRIP
jgi:hypothetical protein